MKKSIILTTLFVANITLPAAKKEEVEQKINFHGLIKQHLQEGGLAKNILDFLDQKEWFLLKQFQTNPHNPLVKALVLKDETIILFYKNGLIEIHEQHHQPTHFNIDPNLVIDYVTEDSKNSEVTIASQNGPIFEIKKDKPTGKWNLIESGNIALGRSAFESQAILIDNLVLNTNTSFGPSTGFTIDANGLAKVYVFANQKEMLEKH